MRAKSGGMFKITVRGVYWFTIIYIIVFSVISWLNSNYEFIYYTFVLLIQVNIGLYLHHKLLFPWYILIGLSLMGLMHILGGNIHLEGTRLYDTYLFGSWLKYDNLVHAVAMFIGTFISYALIKPYIDPDLKVRPASLYLIIFTMTMGLGALNEVIEYFAVIWLDVGEWVGDYYNNALDLVYNGLGSIAACLYMATRKELKVIRREFKMAQRYQDKPSK